MQEERVKKETEAIHLTELVKLKHKFDEAEEQELDEKTFIQALKAVLPESITERQLFQLFCKIDANSDGTVEWNEFINFLINENQQNVSEDSSEQTFLPDPVVSVSEKPESHDDMVSQIRSLGETRIATSGRDGLIRIWNVFTGKCLGKLDNKLGWIVDFAYLPKSNTLAVITFSSIVNFYRVDNFELISQIRPDPYLKHEYPDRYECFAEFIPKATPSCICSHFGPEGTEVIAMGLENGTILIYILKNGWFLACGTKRSKCQTSEMEKSPFLTDHVPRNDAREPTFKNAEVKIFDNLHPGSVLSIAYVDEVGLVSCSEIVVIQGLERDRSMKFTGARDVTSFAYCQSVKLMASSSEKRSLDVWDPHRLVKVKQLTEFNAPVLRVASNETSQKLLTLCADKSVQVFCYRTWKCGQIITDPTPYFPENRFTAFTFHHETNKLITASTRPHIWNSRAPNCGTLSSMHHSSVSTCVYNDTFEQLITCDIHGTVAVWDIHTGENVFRFEVLSGYVTCAKFDGPQRRLYLGTTSGELGLWNFSCGAHLTKFTQLHCTTAHSDEVTCLQYVPDKSLPLIISAGWDGNIRVWHETSKKQQYPRVVMPTRASEPSHEGAITCSELVSFTEIFTGGEKFICKWSLISGRLLSRIPIPSASRFLKWFPKQEKLLVGLDSSLYFYDDGRLSRIGLGADLTSVYADRYELMITALRGYVKVWKVGEELEQIAFWEAHDTTITCMTFIKSSEMIVTATSTGFGRLWTKQGRLIGDFGKEKLWDISSEETFAESETRTVPEDDKFYEKSIPYSPRSGKNVTKRVKPKMKDTLIISPVKITRNKRKKICTHTLNTTLVQRLPLKPPFRSKLKSTEV